MYRFPNLLAWLAFAAGTSLGWNHTDGDVLKAALHTVSHTNDVVLVAFVAPSEPKSQALEKEWLLAVSDTKIPLRSIDCEAESRLCAELMIESYPTLKLFEKADSGYASTTYLGPRRASGILSYMSRMSRPIVTDVEPGSLDTFKIADETVFIGHISATDTAARQAFAEVAEKYREEFTFGLVSGESESPTVECYIVEDGEARSLNSYSEAGALDEFVIKVSRPIIGELTQYNQQRLLDRGWPMVYIFAETEEDRAKLRESLRGFAKGYYDSLTCVTVDPLEFPDLQVKMGLEPGIYPSGAVHQLSKERIYPYPRGLPLESRSLQKWGLDVWQGRVKPWTPPGMTTMHDEDPGPTRVAKRKLSIANLPGVKMQVAGHDEL
ncbi:Protein disulfide-isomerase [Cytospora mali]|uniref:Protein disulfide-isomerase n=1 Tax=Cytospora mali TaxID=578113 RepID=A0A194WBJ0_CYTMA|nr:Protein disulfide-isomerase [Valsa mali]